MELATVRALSSKKVVMDVCSLRLICFHCASGFPKSSSIYPQRIYVLRISD